MSLKSRVRVCGRVVSKALIVLALLVGVPVKAKAAFPGENGKIAFQSNLGAPINDPSRFEIWVMNADGTGQTQLTTSGGTFPSWSPRGTKIAFTSNRDGNFEIYVMNADGSGQTRLTDRPNATDLHPAWSRDGSKIAFSSFDNGNYDIWVMNADGSGQTNLTNDLAEDTLPAWSPDGSTIAFQTNRDGDYEVYTIKPNGTGLTNVSQSPMSYEGEPDWSPDGSKIAFTGNLDTMGYGIDVYVMEPDGSNVARLTSSHEDTTPAWSPDGSRIAFKSHRDFNDEIYVMDADGGNPLRLTDNAPRGNTLPEDWYPDWQPIPSDTTPPEVTCSATPSALWPPNHKLHPVSVLLSASDDSGTVIVTLVSVASDQVGDADDIQGWTLGTDDRSGLLRAERSQQPRTYRIAYRAEDPAGHTTDCEATVVVPKSQAR
jgi:Tol biopolymer transport system component